MGKSSLDKLLVCVLVFVECFILVACTSAPNEDVVANVNGYRITDKEFSRYIATQIPDLSRPSAPDQERMLRLTVLREMIDYHIMLQRAEKLGIRAKDSDVEEKLNEYKTPFATTQRFAHHLQESGIDIGELRVGFLRSITIERLLAREIASKMIVSETEIKNYYDDNKASFYLAEQQTHLAQILVTSTSEIPIPNHRNDDARDLETAQAKTEMIKELLREGQPFEMVARDYSEDPDSIGSGGDLGFIPQSFLEEMDITLRRVVASLSPGEISPIVRSGSEFRILHLISREPAGQREFSDPRVQQSIRETLKNRKEQLLRTAYAEMLRNEANVKNYLAERIVADFDPIN